MDGISDLMRIEQKDWQKEVNIIIRKIAIKQDGYQKFQEVIKKRAI